ncbi:MAG: trypsin-like peptidase domain-containing protein [Planctomycetes bacterium]|nr:trypsin-like peptidase domain-containing protein [Planctomycetota bacterium]
MKRLSGAAIACLLCAAALGCNQAGQFGASGRPESGPGRQIDFQKIIATAKEKVYPALVFVKPIQETFFAGERTRVEVFGSGVIISDDGYVVTNNHVAENAIEVNCVLGDREQVSAQVVGVDPETDLALLKLRLPKDHPALTVAVLGDSSRVEAGQFVMALGSPFGFTRSISLGIVSNTTRYLGFGTKHIYNLWFQTDAVINPGNSGGPLVNTDGQVVGINTLGIGSAGIGFAIPSNVVRDIVDRLRHASAKLPKEKLPAKVDRAYSGLQLQAINDFDSNTFTDSRTGVLIPGVDQDSPAARADVQNGDILLEVNGQPISGLYVEDIPGIRVFLADLPSEQPARCLIARRDKSASQPAAQTQAERAPAAQADIAKDLADRYAGKIGQRRLVMLEVSPVARGKFEGEDLDCKKWNMTVKEITKFSNPGLFFLNPAGGVFIQGVRYPGNAADAQLSHNDIILKIGAAPIKTIDDVKKAYEAAIGDRANVEKKILVTIKRGGFLNWIILNWQKDYLQED